MVNTNLNLLTRGVLSVNTWCPFFYNGYVMKFSPKKMHTFSDKSYLAFGYRYNFWDENYAKYHSFIYQSITLQDVRKYSILRREY